MPTSVRRKSAGMGEKCAMIHFAFAVFLVKRNTNSRGENSIALYICNVPFALSNKLFMLKLRFQAFCIIQNFTLRQ